MGVGKSGKKTSAPKAPPVQRPSYFSETEKAVKLRITVEDVDLEQSRSRFVWVPKSQLAEDGRPSNWITSQKAQEFYSTRRAESQFSVTWEDANGKRFSASATAKEREQAQKARERWNAGVKSYNDLITRAREMGVKGIRVGVKRATIEKKIREYEAAKVK